MQEPEVTFSVRDQFGNEDVLRARLYHPFLDAVRSLLDLDSPALTATPLPPPPPAPPQAAGGTGAAGGAGSGGAGTNQQPPPHGLDVDLYRSSDVSLITLQNSPAACGLQGGESLLLYRYGRCSREYWQGLGQPERGLKPTYAGLYISDYKNQVCSGSIPVCARAACAAQAGVQVAMHACVCVVSIGGCSAAMHSGTCCVRQLEGCRHGSHWRSAHCSMITGAGARTLRPHLPRTPA